LPQRNVRGSGCSGVLEASTLPSPKVSSLLHIPSPIFFRHPFPAACYPALTVSPASLFPLFFSISKLRRSLKVSSAPPSTIISFVLVLPPPISWCSRQVKKHHLHFPAKSPPPPPSVSYGAPGTPSSARVGSKGRFSHPTPFVSVFPLPPDEAFFFSRFLTLALGRCWPTIFEPPPPHHNRRSELPPVFSGNSSIFGFLSFLPSYSLTR